MPTLSQASLDSAISAFKERRAIFDPSTRGVAPSLSSSDFRTKRGTRLPRARRWDGHLSIEAAARQPSTLKASAPPPGTISLGVGRPAAEFYPWLGLGMSSMEADGLGSARDQAKTLSTMCTSDDEGYSLAAALNYGHSTGAAPLLRFVSEHVEYVHQPPYADWETCLTCGTTSAIDMVLRMLCNPGDTILVERNTYTGTSEAAATQGISLLGVAMDDQGLVPQDLDKLLRTWNDSRGVKPHVLYTIPCGQNPTGATQSLQRRLDIYSVAEQHDLIILEDDPYYFLQLSDGVDDSPTKSPLALDSYLRGLPASYLSLDEAGRVIRFDTTSKILAPGLRCGWMTASSQLIEKFCDHTGLSTCSPSGPSQVMLYKLLDEQWGHIGLFTWLNTLSRQYGSRLKTLLSACTKHLPQPLCRWTVPQLGMFLWITVDPSCYANDIGEDDHRPTAVREHGLEERIYSRARASGVQISRGKWFAIADRPSSDVCFRLTFVAASAESIDEAVARFGAAIRSELEASRREFSEDPSEGWLRSPRAVQLQSS